VLLFEDQTTGHLERLARELDELEQGGARLAILSWEGLNTFNRRQLENVRHYLGERPVEVLAYLREQSEVVQSGYLQAIKQRRQKRSLDDFNNCDRIITPRHIDYHKLLQRYAAVFGQDKVRARIYERKLLRGENIVLDFLAAIGAEADDRWILAPNEQNVSLDVGSACVLNVMDVFYSDKVERDNLVDLLLCHINEAGADEKNFLYRENVEKIRQHYAESNALVLRDFVEVKPGRDTLFCLEKTTWISSARLAELGAAKFLFLAGLTDYRSWRGQALRAELLQTVASPVLGWSQPEQHGLWSRGDLSQLRFRICPTMIPIQVTQLSMRFRGDYFADNASSRVVVPGMAEQRLSLADGVLQVPLASFDANGCIDIILKHDKPVTPRSLGMNNDERELAFLLRELSYSLDA